MKISKSSWHFRLVDSILRPSESLCIYFWQIPLCMLVSVVILLVILVALTFVLSPLALLAHSYTGFMSDHYVEGVLWYDIVNAGATASVVWIVFTSATATCYVYHLTYMFRIGREDKPKGVVAEYINAKKEKVCPRIEWED